MESLKWINKQIYFFYNFVVPLSKTKFEIKIYKNTNKLQWFFQHVLVQFDISSVLEFDKFVNFDLKFFFLSYKDRNFSSLNMLLLFL